MDFILPLIPQLIPLIAGAIASLLFEPIQKAIGKLNGAHPLVRFALSGLWAGLVGYLATVNIPAPASIAQFTSPALATMIAALATWGFHALIKSASVTGTSKPPVAPSLGTPVK